MNSHNFATNEKSKEEYMTGFVQPTNMIDSIVGKPTYHMVRQVRLGLEDNLKAMKDYRDPKYGKLCLIKDVWRLNGRPMNVRPELMSQGLPAYLSTDYYFCQDYATEYVNKQEAYLND